MTNQLLSDPVIEKRCQFWYFIDNAGSPIGYMPTSLEDMKISSPGLRTLASMPIAPGVAVHSIIPVEGDGPPAQGNDGVVKYTNGHRDGADSEVIARWNHSCQATPEAIEAVRRILYLHLDQP